MKVLFIASVFLASCFFQEVNSTRRWLKEEFPNPTKDLGICGRRGKVSLICDPDNVLSYKTANKLEELLYSIGKNTASGCSSDEKPGFQVGVAVLKRMRIFSWESVEETAEKFTKHLHDSWGVGHAGCDDGAMLLLSIHNRQVYISTGKKAMELLSDDQINIIIEQMKPYLRRKDYDKSVEHAVVRIGEVFSGKVLDRPPNYCQLIITTVVIAMVGVLGVWLYSLHKEEQEREDRTRELWRIHDEKLFGKFCPICLEEFQQKPKLVLSTCFHKFCKPCLTKWLKNKDTCPVCRQSADILNKDVTYHTYDFSREDPSLVMIQRPLRPSVILQTNVNRGSNSYTGSFDSDPIFARSSMVGNGSFGSNGGFGGGSSAGGGLVGGSW